MQQLQQTVELIWEEMPGSRKELESPACLKWQGWAREKPRRLPPPGAVAAALCHVTQCSAGGSTGRRGSATPLTFPSTFPPPSQGLDLLVGWFSSKKDPRVLQMPPPFFPSLLLLPAPQVLATAGRVCPQVLAHSTLLSGSTPLGFRVFKTKFF